MFWSQARGKVGDVVISRIKGQTITRAYNPTQTNPKSEKQMTQRAKFSGAVKFFKYGTQNLFKFAYEDKKQVESDFNAFMRYNAKNFAITSREDFLDSDAFPYAQFSCYPVISQGRLGNFTTYHVPDSVATNNSIWIPDTGQELIFEEAPTTWGQISQKYIDTYGLLKGDYITLLHINTGVLITESGKIKEGNLKWNIYQYQLDPTSTADVPWIMGVDEDGYLQYQPNVANAVVQYFGIVFSRETKGGLWVSTSIIDGNSVAQNESFRLSTKAVIDENLKTWGATPNSILQGSLVTPIEPTPPTPPEPEPIIEGFKGTASNAETAYGKQMTSSGENLYTAPEAGVTDYVWVKGSNLDLLDNDDLSVSTEGNVTSIEFTTPATEHEGHRCIKMVTSSGATGSTIVSVGQNASFGLNFGF